MTFLLAALLGTFQHCVLASGVSVSIQALAAGRQVAKNSGPQPASFRVAGWSLQDKMRHGQPGRHLQAEAGACRG